MSRFLLLVLLWSLLLAPSADAANWSDIVDLNEPEILAAVAHNNPDHYQKIKAIIDNVLKQPEEQVLGWLQTTFDARDITYTWILLTSYPPKRDLSFLLDETRYKIRLTITGTSHRSVPAKQEPE